MKEYEILDARPQTNFEEAELNSTDDYIRTKHYADFDKFVKEILPTGQIVYTYDNGTVRYVYEFTEI